MTLSGQVPSAQNREEDLSADDTIDRQVAKEQRQSKEENLLAEKQED